MQARFKVSTGIVAISCIAAFFALTHTRDNGTPCKVSITDTTSVLNASIRLTYGTNHSFYYPSQFQWRWREVCRWLGLPINWAIQKQEMRTYQSCPVLWLTCIHAGDPPQPKHFQAYVGKRVITCTGGVHDRNNKVTVCKFPVLGGFEKNKGGTMRIVNSETGIELASIRFPGKANEVGAANGSQPIRSETNQTSSAAGSRR
jgi:hypothetical protein